MLIDVGRTAHSAKQQEAKDAQRKISEAHLKKYVKMSFAMVEHAANASCDGNELTASDAGEPSAENPDHHTGWGENNALQHGRPDIL